MSKKCSGCGKEGKFSNNICDTCHSHITKNHDTKAKEPKIKKVDKGEKYMVTIRERSTGKTIKVDAYDIIVACKIVCPSKAHAVKKILFSGTRGVKDEDTDIDEAINSLEISKALKAK